MSTCVSGPLPGGVSAACCGSHGHRLPYMGLHGQSLPVAAPIAWRRTTALSSTVHYLLIYHPLYLEALTTPHVPLTAAALLSTTTQPTLNSMSEWMRSVSIAGSRAITNFQTSQNTRLFCCCFWFFFCTLLV